MLDGGDPDMHTVRGDNPDTRMLMGGHLDTHTLDGGDPDMHTVQGGDPDTRVLEGGHLDMSVGSAVCPLLTGKCNMQKCSLQWRGVGNLTSV